MFLTSKMIREKKFFHEKMEIKELAVFLMGDEEILSFDMAFKNEVKVVKSDQPVPAPSCSSFITKLQVNSSKLQQSFPA